MTEHKAKTISNSPSPYRVYDEAYKQGKADEREKTIYEIHTFCSEYNKNFKCFGECSKCPLGSFKEQMKGEVDNENETL